MKRVRISALMASPIREPSLLLGAILAAGCGDDDDGQDTAPDAQPELDVSDALNDADATTDADARDSASEDIETDVDLSDTDATSDAVDELEEILADVDDAEFEEVLLDVVDASDVDSGDDAAETEADAEPEDVSELSDVPDADEPDVEISDEEIDVDSDADTDVVEPDETDWTGDPGTASIDFLIESARFLDEQTVVVRLNSSVGEVGAINLEKFRLSSGYAGAADGDSTTYYNDVGFAACTVYEENIGITVDERNELEIVCEDISLAGLDSLATFATIENSETDDQELVLTLTNPIQPTALRVLCDSAIYDNICGFAGLEGCDFGFFVHYRRLGVPAVLGTSGEVLGEIADAFIQRTVGAREIRKPPTAVFAGFFPNDANLLKIDCE